MSDVRIQICDFHTPSKSAGKLINKDSVKKVLASENFKKNLENGRILGLATHKSRYDDMDPNIPYEDQIFTSPYLTNCARAIWIDESKDALMGDFDYLDTTYGKLTKDLLKKGIMIPVSMSVSATSDDKYYYVEDILGVDQTFKPDLQAKILKVNFSETDIGKEIEKDINGKHYISFSTMAKIEDPENVEDNDSVDVCPHCSLPFNECNCQLGKVHSIRKPTIKREYSQTNIVKPNITKPDTPKCDIVKAKPIDNREVPKDIEVVTNLDTNVAGNNVECITTFSESGNDNIIYLKDNGYLKGVNDSGNPIWCETIDCALKYDDDTARNLASKFCAEILKQMPTASIEEIHKDIPVEDQLTLEELAKLPSEISSTVTMAVNSNFSLQQYLMEVNKPPYMVFFRRINEVIQLCRSKGSQVWIDSNLKWLRAYFDSYFLTWINQTLQSDNEFNVMMGLRLAKFEVDQQKMRRMNLVMKRVKKILMTTGFITKPLQEELNAAFQDIENDIYNFITKFIKDYNKTNREAGLTFTPDLEQTSDKK